MRIQRVDRRRILESPSRPHSRICSCSRVEAIRAELKNYSTTRGLFSRRTVSLVRTREREKESRSKICLDNGQRMSVFIFLDRVLATLASSSKRPLLARSAAVARDPKPVFCIRNPIRVTFSDPVHRLPTTYPLRDIGEFVPAIVRREPQLWKATSPRAFSDLRSIISSFDPHLSSL